MTILVSSLSSVCWIWIIFWPWPHGSRLLIAHWTKSRLFSQLYRVLHNSVHIKTLSLFTIFTTLYVCNVLWLCVVFISSNFSSMPSIFLLFRPCSCCLAPFSTHSIQHPKASVSYPLLSSALLITYPHPCLHLRPGFKARPCIWPGFLWLYLHLLVSRVKTVTWIWN